MAFLVGNLDVFGSWKGKDPSISITAWLVAIFKRDKVDDASTWIRQKKNGHLGFRPLVSGVREITPYSLQRIGHFELGKAERHRQAHQSNHESRSVAHTHAGDIAKQYYNSFIKVRSTIVARNNDTQLTTASFTQTQGEQGYVWPVYYSVRIFLIAFFSLAQNKLMFYSALFI